MNNEQLIQRYITEQLNTEERAAFEQRIETDVDFKSEFESHWDIAMAFKISEAQNIKDQLKQLDKDEPQSKSLYSRLKYLYFAVASIFIIGIFYTIFNTTSGSDVFHSNFEIYPNTYEPITRSNDVNETNSPFVAYENRDFIKAEKGFQTRLKHSENSNIRFYYAMTLLNQEKFDVALEQLKNITDSNYTAEVYWYAALIHLKNENYKKAQSSLEQLKSLHSPYKKKEAELLFNTINKRN